MRYNGLLGGGQSIILLEAKAHGYLGYLKIRSIMQSTISMRSMLMLGRSGGMPLPGKF